MGQAKRRGTFEQRKAQAIERQRKANESIAAKLPVARIEAQTPPPPPPEIRFHRHTAGIAALWFAPFLWK